MGYGENQAVVDGFVSRVSSAKSTIPAVILNDFMVQTAEFTKSTLNSIKASINTEKGQYRLDLTKCDSLNATFTGLKANFECTSSSILSSQSHIKNNFSVGGVVPGESNSIKGAQKSMEVFDKMSSILNEIADKKNEINNVITKLDSLSRECDSVIQDINNKINIYYVTKRNK